MTKPRSGVRPTTRKVLESLFAILDGMLETWEGVRVVDAFAGAGQLGGEALERGAASVTFIEMDLTVAADLRRRFRGERRAQIVKGDARQVLERVVGPFDLAFLDPPYSAGLAAAALEVLDRRGLIDEGGIVVAEHHHKDPMPAQGETLATVRQQRYGETALTFYWRARSA
jgi:16S rRNA (guanine966-N2)-methyltransferase